MLHDPVRPAAAGPADDDELVRRAVARDAAAVRAIMQKHNRRLFRLARSILRDDGEVEDVLQESYVRAFSHIAEFRGGAALSTWLSRIVINEALGRLRRRRGGEVSLDSVSAPAADIILFPRNDPEHDPERTMAQREILRIVEQAIDALPDIFRTVLVARLVEGLSVEETADLLSLRAETVKTRLFRARQMLREHIDSRIDPVLFDAFPFAGIRCERVIERVIGDLGLAREASSLAGKDS
jgi:RNA polymerase sigma-70 factor (ECF subfamily)